MSDDDLAVEVREIGGSITITAIGEIDLASCDTLRDALMAIDSSAAVLLDLGAIDFIDSTGLRVLLEEHGRRQLGGGSLRISVMSIPVSHLLEISNLDDLLDSSH